MHIVFHKQFEKDISKYPPDLLRDIFHFVETVEEADTLYAMPHIKKMQGYKNYYRYKIGDYRVGFSILENGYIQCERCLHRKDIYKKFP